VLNQIGETFAGRVAARLGIKEVADDIWLVSFMHCGLGYFDLEQKKTTSRQPVRRAVVTHVLGTLCYLCVRAGQTLIGGDGGIRTLDRALQPYNGLANRRLQPLGHVSSRADMPDTAASRKRQIARFRY
jgi:hypothetical protein